jgi:hypothetical protein
MASDYLPDDLKILWKELSTNPRQISPYQLRKEAEKLRTGLRRRSVVGGGAALLVFVAFTLFFFVFPNALQRVGSILTVAGAGYIVVQLRMRPARTMADIGETDCIRFYRGELARQRDFHRGKWFWSRLLVLLPGVFIWSVGFAQSYPKLAPFIWLEFMAFLILAAIAVPFNLRLARKYQHRIDVLDISLKSTN